jgi:hypothetical protein
MQKKQVVSIVCGLAVLFMLVPFALADRSASEGVGVFQNRPELYDPTPAPAPRRDVTTPGVTGSSSQGVGVFQGRPELYDPTPAPASRRLATASSVSESSDTGVGVFQGRPELFDPTRGL